MRQLLYFILGLIIPLIIYFAGAYFLVALTFTLASRTLSEKENVDALCFYSVLAGLVVFALIAFKQYKLNRKYFSLGITLSLVPVVIVLFKLSIIYFDDLNYYQAFNKKQWMEDELKPFNMAKTLAKQKVLVGLNRGQVIDKLGYFKENAGFNGQTLVYWTERNWQFLVNLRKDTVIDTELYEPGLD